jgi:hypothetical protein
MEIIGFRGLNVTEYADSAVSLKPRKPQWRFIKYLPPPLPQKGSFQHKNMFLKFGFPGINEIVESFAKTISDTHSL